ncbi:MAG: matrixin family metalloprotease, partial [Niabella sp.]
ATIELNIKSLFWNFCALFGLVILFLISCRKGGDDEFIEQAKSNVDKTIIASLGFDTTNLKEYKDSYLVEGDIVLHKKKLKSYIKRQALFNTNAYPYFSLVSLEYQNNITIRIHENVPNDNSNMDYRTSIQMAVNKWNNCLPNTNIRFSLVESNTADITFHTDYFSNTNTAAFIDDFSEGGKPSNFITLNTNYHFHNKHYTNEQKMWIILHELGHAIGLAHSDEADSTITDLIPDTPEKDTSSVFKSGMAGLIFDDFTYWDKFALEKIYPPVKAKLIVINNSYTPFTISINSYITNNITTISSYPFSNIYYWFDDGPYYINFSPMYNGSTSSQLHYNGSTYTGNTFNFSNIYLSVYPNPPFLIEAANSQTTYGSCLISPADNFEVQSSQLEFNSTLNEVNGYIAWNKKYDYPWTPFNSGQEYLIATIPCNRPTTLQTFSFTEIDRVWTLSVAPNGEVKVSYLGLPYNPYESPNEVFYFSYKL